MRRRKLLPVSAGQLGGRPVRGGRPFQTTEAEAPMSSPEYIDPARLERALRIAARVVREHGPAYLPIFERLEAEHKRTADLAERLARALGETDS